MTTNRLYTNIPLVIFILVDMAVAAYIYFTMGELPEKIASHFNASGIPNGFMSQQGYTVFMLIFAVVMPSFMAFSGYFVMGAASDNINIPNKHYWLSPENRDKTIQYLKEHIVWLGSMIALFIAYVHSMIIKANHVQPPQLQNDDLYICIGVLLTSILIWGFLLIVKFMRTPEN